MTQMNEGESVPKLFACVVLLMNQMNVCGDSITDLQKIE